jgi:hypothetical protein
MKYLLARTIDSMVFSLGTDWAERIPGGKNIAIRKKKLMVDLVNLNIAIGRGMR